MSDRTHSTSVQDYLKALYELGEVSGVAAASDVAGRLAVSPASVSAMVRRLAEQGLVDFEPYREVRLTAEGRREALRLVRRHRVIEAYLVSALGYQWDEVHEEAERLEHAVSDQLIDRMAAAIGEPATDPHGSPIPTADGVVAKPIYRQLDQLEVGETARVAMVEDDDADLLRYLASLNLMPGAEVSYLGREPFGGPLMVLVDGASVQVGPDAAARVLVASSPAPM